VAGVLGLGSVELLTGRRCVEAGCTVADLGSREPARRRSQQVAW
jgi:hypothetical protein